MGRRQSGHGHNLQNGHGGSTGFPATVGLGSWTVRECRDDTPGDTCGPASSHAAWLSRSNPVRESRNRAVRAARLRLRDRYLEDPPARLLHPLTGSTTWVEYEGTTVVRKVWDGRANLVELEADGPAGHIEGLSLRLYNPQSRQWSLNFSNSRSGTLSPPIDRRVQDGRGEFYGQESLDGRAIFVRFVISAITPDFVPFRAVLLGRRRQDLGAQLGRDGHPGQGGTRHSALSERPGSLPRMTEPRSRYSSRRTSAIATSPTICRLSALTLSIVSSGVCQDG